MEGGKEFHILEGLAYRETRTAAVAIEIAYCPALAIGSAAQLAPAYCPNERTLDPQSVALVQHPLMGMYKKYISK